MPTILDAKTDISLIEIQAELLRHGVVVGATSTIGRFLRRAGLTRKNVWPAPSASGFCEAI
jgi:putative transposase